MSICIYLGTTSGAEHKQISNFIPVNNRTANLIIFEADIKPYSYDSSKHLLFNIRNIEFA